MKSPQMRLPGSLRTETSPRSAESTLAAEVKGVILPRGAFVISLVSLGDAIARIVLFNTLLIKRRASLKGMTERVREKVRVKIRKERAKSNKLNLPKPLALAIRIIPKQRLKQRQTPKANRRLRRKPKPRSCLVWMMQGRRCQ